MNQRVVTHRWGTGDSAPIRMAMRDLNGSMFSLVFADPPYNQGIKYEDDPTKDRLTMGEYVCHTRQWLREIKPLMLPGATIWWMVPERLADAVGHELTNEIGPRLYRIIFEESFAQYQQHTLTMDYRMIFCHQVEGGPLTFNPDAIREMSVRQEMGDKRADPRGRVPGQVWKMRRLQGTARDRVDWHPTQLAPEVLRRIVRGWSVPGDLTCDMFAGSGNWGMVCEQEKRKSVLVDQSPTYVTKIRERLSVYATPKVAATS